MGGGARALVRQPKTAVFLRKSPKSGGSQSVNFLQYWHARFAWNMSDHHFTYFKLISNNTLVFKSAQEETSDMKTVLWYNRKCHSNTLSNMTWSKQWIRDSLHFSDVLVCQCCKNCGEHSCLTLQFYLNTTHNAFKFVMCVSMPTQNTNICIEWQVKNCLMSLN